MLTEFSIGNYQAFSTSQRVPLKPITLIFGPNSAGKSSLLRSLLVARHAILNGKLSKSEGAGERHPGSFSVIARNGRTNPVGFDFLVNTKGKETDGTIGLCVEWKENDSGVLETASLSLKSLGSKIVRYESKWGYKHLQIESLGDELLKLSSTARLSTDSEGCLDELVRRSFDKRLCLQKHKALPGTDADDFRFETSGSDDDLDLVGNIDAMSKKEPPKEVVVIWREALKKALDSSRSLIEKSIATVESSLRECLTTLDYHGPIRPICDEISQAQSGTPGMSGWWNLAADPKLLAKVNDWLSSEVFKTKFRLEFDRLFPDSALKQLLHILSKEKTIKNLIQASIDAKLESEPSALDGLTSDMAGCLSDDDFEDTEELWKDAEQQAREVLKNQYEEEYECIRAEGNIEETEEFLIGGMNAILSSLQGMLESVRLGSVRTQGGFDSAKIRFFDSRAESAVSPSNMGIGFSQMMPLVASAFGSKNRLIVIEQPELHVHPALQMELADLFIESVAERNNRFLIETHSEHLILRVLRRIRETNSGTLEPDKYPIRQDQVAVLYVEPSPDGSRVIELPITADGDFSVPWPTGFFAERASELF